MTNNKNPQKCLTPSPSFKREVPLIEDKEDEFIINIKDEFPFIVTREMWDISSVITGDGYLKKEDDVLYKEPLDKPNIQSLLSKQMFDFDTLFDTL